MGVCVTSQHPLRTAVTTDDLFIYLGVVNGISPNSQVFTSQEEVKLFDTSSSGCICAVKNGQKDPLQRDSW